MLRELKLENYRGFTNHTIPFRKLNVIVGANNAGKSTVVEALRIISFTANRYRNLTYRKVPDWLEISGRNFGVTPSLKNTEIKFESICNQYRIEQPAKIVASFNDGSSITTYLNHEGNIHSIIETPNKKIISSRSDARKIDLPSINILPQVGPVQSDEVILDSDYVKSAVGSAVSPLHFRNQLFVFNKHFSQFQEMVEKTWTGVMVRKLYYTSRLPKTPLSLEIRNENFVAEVAAIGMGYKCGYK